MRSRTRVLVGVALVVAVALVAGGIVLAVRRGAPATVCPDDDASSAPGWVATNTDVNAGFERHPFVGNGYLGLRVPPRGPGYALTGEPSGWPLYTPRYDGAFVAGLYGHTPGVAEDREVVAALPNWSALTVGVGEDTYSPNTPAEQITDFSQTAYLRCGLVRTALTWTSRDGRATDLVYDVLADRVDQHVGAVRLTAVPHWSGELAVTDLIDGAGARRMTQTIGGASEGGIKVGFRADGTGVVGAVASVLSTGAARRPDAARDLTVAQQNRLTVRAGKSYAVTKFVGVDTALTARDPVSAAQDAAQRAARKGWPDLLAGTAAAWRALWRGDIEVPANPDFQTWVRGALYSLYSSTNSQQDNSISPVGLSSDNYGGAVFWDADIWMLPGLLQFAPDLAKSIVQYRFKTLPAAQANARQLGFRGAFYPWTSASRGALAECHSWDPPHCLTQNHLQGDVSLAAWQYYLATGDIDYLRGRSWPIMRSVAEFWASRATPNPDGSYSIENVAGPDEYSNGVDDGAYTNAVAALALRNAARAADLLREQAPPEWTAIADRLRMPFDQARRIFSQYDGYAGTPIKQADTAMLIYPLEWPMPEEVSRNILEYYADRTDPDGPAMTDAVHAIDAAAIGMPGCATGTYLERAVRPFERAPFGQFAEARGDKAGVEDPLAGAPAFTFVTAAGGFVQTFTNGLLGLRLRGDRVRVDPTLPPRFGAGLRIRGMHWQGRTFDAEIGRDDATITLRDGAAMPVESAAGTQLVSREQPLSVKTRRPDLLPTDNLARCKSVSASSAEPGRYAEAAVDGSSSTGWVADADRGVVTVDLGAETVVGRVLPHWQQRPPGKAELSVSSDDRTWTRISADPVTGVLANPLSARYIRVDITADGPGARPGLRELEVYGPPS
ncbi:trehalose/maltose hydrolase-like predicted phosphorylase [Nocardia tenerifensis]|uniref:Trehalose/maltose hydrolase-like predicted phosphorylase n=1 Tax=Nocardia tenerifensis TaxID=228006 RepID=A0A318K257_9NOCA|nr:trehalose/maltose hydrolase-like predicted phosphorylase [Nocardia tenerifensis]